MAQIIVDITLPPGITGAQFVAGITAGVRELLREIAAEAAARAPRDTGRLARSITSRAAARGTMIEGEVDGGVDYALAVDRGRRGTPPSADDVRGWIVRQGIQLRDGRGGERDLQRAAYVIARRLAEVAPARFGDAAVRAVLPQAGRIFSDAMRRAV